MYKGMQESGTAWFLILFGESFYEKITGISKRL